MAIQLIAASSSVAFAPPLTASVTIDATGADYIVAISADFGDIGDFPVNDSEANTYVDTGIDAFNTSGFQFGKYYEVINPTTSSTLTITSHGIDGDPIPFLSVFALANVTGSTTILTSSNAETSPSSTTHNTTVATNVGADAICTTFILGASPTSYGEDQQLVDSFVDEDTYLTFETGSVGRDVQSATTATSVDGYISSVVINGAGNPPPPPPPGPALIISSSLFNFPATAANVAAPGGDANWTNVDNAKADDANFARVTLAKNDQSNYLRLTNFGFTTSDIPSGATIRGIELVIDRKTSASTVADTEIRLRKTSGQVGSNASDGNWPTTFTEKTYGGSTDLFGTTWTVADITNSNFGVDIECRNVNTNSNLSADVNFAKIKVHYSIEVPVTGSSQRIFITST